MKTLYRKLKELKKHPNNPREITKEDFEILKKSINDNSEYFEARPILLSNRTGELVIIAGNMRYEAARSLGLKEVPTFLMEGLSELKESEIAIRDNVQNGRWDFDVLSGWDDLPLTDWGVDLPEDWVGNGNEPLEEDEEKLIETIDKAKELQEKWQTATGQLWQLGEHRILCGDSTKREDVERLMGEYKVSLVWTDPPYGINYGQKLDDANPITHRVRNIANDNLNDAELETLIKTAFKNACNVSNDQCSIYVACPPGKQLPTLIKAFDNSGFKFCWQLVWEKDSLVLSRADYHFRHENILYGWRTGQTHYFVDERHHDSIFTYDRPKVSDKHPTMKPPLLIQDMLRNSSKKGDVVYDCFNGSGSTMIACENEGRKYRGIELEAKYIAVTLERYFNLTGKEPKLLDE